MRQVRLAAILATTVAVAAAPVPRFAPDARGLYRLTIENRPAAGAGAYVFVGSYDLVFAPEGTGWTATLTLRHVTATAPAAMARMFEAGHRPMIDQPMIFHLDAAARIVSLDDEEALMRRFTEGVADTAGSRGGDGAVAARLAAPLLALPPDRRRAFLSSALETALAAADAGRPAESGRRVTVPGFAPGAAGAVLAGTQDVIREATGGLVVRTRAEGTGAAGNRLDLSIERRIDPVHGLLVREEKTVETRPDEGDRTGIASDVTVTTLALVS